VKYWKTWEIRKGGSDDIIIIADPADTGIGVEARKNGVVVSKGRLSVGDDGKR